MIKSGLFSNSLQISEFHAPLSSQVEQSLQLLEEKLADQGCRYLEQDLQLARAWVSDLLALERYLRSIGLWVVNWQFEDILNEWLVDWHHGAWHAISVYRGMKELMIIEELEVSDHLVQLAALFHDLSRVFPPQSPWDAQEQIGNHYLLHPQLSANLILVYGTHLGLLADEVLTLYRSILHHDDALFRKGVPDDLPLLGHILSDSDKIYPLGVSEDYSRAIQEVMTRNLEGSKSIDSWYFFRDMSVEDRNLFQHGDRWLTDNVSCVRNEALKIKPHTNAGKKVFKSKKEHFFGSIEGIYGRLFDEYVELIKSWQEMKASGQAFKIAMVGFSGEKGKPHVVELKPQEEISSLIQDAYEKPLSLPAKYIRSEYKQKPRGWNIALEINGEVNKIDPSVARFAFDESGELDENSGKARFIREVTQAFAS